MSTAISRELRNLYKEVDGLHRRLAASHMSGRVVEIKGDKVRLELMPPDSRTGKPFLSPWVQVQESAGDGVGGYSTHVPVAIGETMRLLSPQERARCVRPPSHRALTRATAGHQRARTRGGGAGRRRRRRSDAVPRHAAGRGYAYKR